MPTRCSDCHRALILVAFVLLPHVAQAQTATVPNWPGLMTARLMPVYVMDDAGAETLGRLVSLSPESLVLAVDGAERRFEPARVRRIQRRGDSLKNGAIAGAIVGVVLGSLSAGISDCADANPGGTCTGQRVAFAVLGVGIYTSIGVAIDALYTGRTTIYEAQGSRR